MREQHLWYQAAQAVLAANVTASEHQQVAAVPGRCCFTCSCWLPHADASCRGVLQANKPDPSTIHTHTHT